MRILTWKYNSRFFPTPGSSAPGLPLNTRAYPVPPSTGPPGRLGGTPFAGPRFQARPGTRPPREGQARGARATTQPRVWLGFQETRVFLPRNSAHPTNEPTRPAGVSRSRTRPSRPGVRWLGAREGRSLSRAEAWGRGDAARSDQSRGFQGKGFSKKRRPERQESRADVFSRGISRDDKKRRHTNKNLVGVVSFRYRT